MKIVGALTAAVVILGAGAAAWFVFTSQPEPEFEERYAADHRTLEEVSASELAELEPWAEAEEWDLRDWARDGLGHPLFAETRGGVERTAAIMDRLMPYFERFWPIPKRVHPDVLAAVIMVESGGRADLTEEPDSSSGRAGLAGLTPAAARESGLRVDEKRSDQLTRQIADLTERQAKAKSKPEAAELDPKLIAFRARRRKLDERFDVRRAIEGAAVRLHTALREFDDLFLAVAAYRTGTERMREIVKASPRRSLSFYDLYFAGTPGQPGPAGRRLFAEGPEVADFPFVVEAARWILSRYTNHPANLFRAATLHGTKPGAEDVLWPPEKPTRAYWDHEEIKDDLEEGGLVAFSDDPERTGFLLSDDPNAQRVFRSELHRALRPDALALLMYIAGVARAESHETELTLEVASAVRPETVKQREEAAARSAGNGVAGPGYPLSSKYLRPPASTGYSFELRRTLPGQQQKVVDSVIGRLRALGVLEVVRDGDIDRITAGHQAAAILRAARKDPAKVRQP